MQLRNFPVRWILTFVVLAICVVATMQVALAPTSAGAEMQIGWYEPPPPIIFFVFSALVLPGCLASLPLIMAALLLTLPEWTTYVACIPGALFFWYWIGWDLDLTRGLIQRDNPPRIVGGYLTALTVLSWVALALMCLKGLTSQGSFCGNGPQPSPVTDYVITGIVTVWGTLGAFFGTRRLNSKPAIEFDGIGVTTAPPR